MADEHVDLLEGAFVEEMIDPLPGGQLPLFMLAIDSPATAGVKRLLTELA
jgi:hypothetical protein